MNEEKWNKKFHSRTILYNETILPSEQWIAVTVEPEYAARYDGQVATITAALIFGAMTPSLALDIPDATICPPLPWAGQSLRELIFENLFARYPHGHFEMRASRSRDYRLKFGRNGSGFVAFGSGWNAFIGNVSSPLPISNDLNPVGPALAAIMAASSAFRLRLKPLNEIQLIDAFNWVAGNAVPQGRPYPKNLKPGNIWTIGAGSVGTSTAFFLSLATRNFTAAVFDHDPVGIENIGRSPIFRSQDVDKNKASRMSEYLRSVGVKSVHVEPVALHKSAFWFDRPAGTPDIIVSAANEMNVRQYIEDGAPPIQIYGTTGRNWQMSMIRHIPNIDACSCCAFPPSKPTATTLCATVKVTDPKTKAQVDAALPFLSFGAGLMAASEILKLSLPGYPFTKNRVILNMYMGLTPMSTPITPRADCVCTTRSDEVHRRMIAGSRYANLSA